MAHGRVSRGSAHREDGRRVRLADLVHNRARHAIVERAAQLGEDLALARCDLAHTQTLPHRWEEESQKDFNQLAWQNSIQ